MKARAGFLGGLEKYTHQLIQAFVQQGCQVTLLTTGNPSSIKGTNVISLLPDSKFSLYQLFRFDRLCQKWLQKYPHDMIFGMERTTHQTHYRAGGGVHAVYLKRRAQFDSEWKRWTFSLNPLHNLILNFEKKAFEDRDLKVLFTNSQMVKEEILSHYQTPAEKIKVVHNGVEWKKWHEHFEKSFPRNQDDYRLLFIGNGYKRKGLEFLLMGLEQCKEEKFKLTIIGKEKHPHIFMKQAKKMGLEKKIRFLGPQQNMIPFYQDADALILPSIYDPFANVTVEALAMGLFVMTSLYNGGHEVLHPNTGAIIEDLTSPESTASAIKKAFRQLKSQENALKIRESIKELDFSNQLSKIVQISLDV